METIALMRVAIVAWDLSTNTVGRAYTLAEMLQKFANVEIVGPIWEHGEDEIWLPIRTSNIPITALRCRDLQTLFRCAAEFASSRRFDVVIVSKARLPSILIGFILKLQCKAHAVIDVDEDEMSFFSESVDAGASMGNFESISKTDCERPWNHNCTRLAQQLLPAFDAISVSNVALQKRYSAPIIRHSRDESKFNPKLYDRRSIRDQLGISSEDRVVLFLGTRRDHKGIESVARAIEKINDPRIVLIIIGAPDPIKLRDQLTVVANIRIRTYGEVSWDRLPELTCIADAVCLMQNPNSAVSQYQIPAKLSDAIALGVPIVCTNVPPLRDLIEMGVVLSATEESLPHTLVQALELSKNTDHLKRSRASFLQDFSNSVNGARLMSIIEDMKCYASNDETVQAHVEQIATAVGYLRSELSLSEASSNLREEEVPQERPPPQNRDVVIFWKANDSDVYGRRHDCFTNALREHSTIRRVIHFDRPIAIEELLRLLSDERPLSHSRHIATEIIRRHFGASHRPNVLRHSFIYRKEYGTQSFFGRLLPLEKEYTSFVKQQLRVACVAHNPIAWVYPPNDYFPEIAKAVSFSRIIVDIVDDDRSWATSEKRRASITKNYEDILSCAHIPIANCEAVKAALQYACERDITIIPNGYGATDAANELDLFHPMRGIARPIIGYVGNLRDRINVEMIGQLALAKPNWSFVFIGSMHGVSPAHVLGEYNNVHFLGVVPYPESNSYIKAFDVAIIPHIRGMMTNHMNPLKQYIYRSLDVPIVSTGIHNIDQNSETQFGDTALEFSLRIENLLQNKPQNATRSNLEIHHLWSNKVDNILLRL